MRRSLPIVVVILLFALTVMVIWVSNLLDFADKPLPLPPTRSEIKSVPPVESTVADSLLAGYADPSTVLSTDLREIHRVATGYFSVIKESSRFPISSNKDLSTALCGENANREIFVSSGHPAFFKEGLLADCWGSPLIVLPEVWRQLELRLAGPDRVPHNANDLTFSPAWTAVKN